MRPSFSTPWPMTRHLQWAHVGARAWMAHSKLSNVCEAPRIVTWKALSYSFPHTSQRAAGIVDLPASGREAPYCERASRSVICLIVSDARDPSSTWAMSERLITPHRHPFSSVTIMRDFWRSPMSCSASVTSSLGRQATTSGVMTSAAAVVGGRPSATMRMAMSRSVIAPSTFLLESQTGRNPTFASRMRRAASWTGCFGSMHPTSRFMMSSQRIWSSLRGELPATSCAAGRRWIQYPRLRSRPAATLRPERSKGARHAPSLGGRTSRPAGRSSARKDERVRDHGDHEDRRAEEDLEGAGGGRRVEHGNEIVLDESTRVACRARLRAQPVLERGERTCPARPFHENTPERGRELEPSRSWPAQDQERPRDDEEDEAEVDDEHHVREEGVQHVYMLHPRRTSLTAPPTLIRGDKTRRRLPSGLAPREVHRECMRR